MTLIEFLLARIAEDERLLDADRVYGGGGEIWTIEAHNRAHAQHAAYRRIVTNARQHVGGQRGYGAAIYAAKCLAMIYADHPDYRDEWGPS